MPFFCVLIKRTFGQEEKMAVRTTLHLNRRMAEVLDENAKKLGLSRSELVMMLAYRQMMRNKKRAAFLQVVRYQKRKPNTEWKSVHIAIKESDYVFLVEMRCFYKISVSCLINMALCELLYSKYCIYNNRFIKNFKDKNLYNGHGMMTENTKTSVCWRIYWNLPTNPRKIFIS